ncbi:trypsin alpha-3-like [Wyeomyia smithii]|uniref:trypsin alpha-3-like n=1 Tax=Wyeomyia smithii TaxID=174621 RepID=UPI002467E396|nr:trypsin alpha-3-like [Wyeomyia smithii]
MLRCNRLLLLSAAASFLSCLLLGTPLAASGYESRIVGGENATATGAPYTVAIRSTANSFLCNGILISNRDVLTAAQCVYNGSTVRKASEFQVVLGTLINSNTTTNATVRSVWRVSPHESFNTTTRINDLAVLRLNENVTSINTVGFGATTPAVNRSCDLFGWGANTTTGSPAVTLQRIKLQVQTSSSAHCLRTTGGTALASGMFCAGDLLAGRGACTGDLGAPLLCDGTLYGVLSLVGGCGAVNETSVFTDTTKYITWIISKVQLAVTKPSGGGAAQVVLNIGVLVLSVVCSIMMAK